MARNRLIRILSCALLAAAIPVTVGGQGLCGIGEAIFGPVLEEPKLSLGYATKSDGAEITLDTDGGNLNHLTKFTHEYGLRGLWVELGLALRFAETAGIEFNLGHLFSRHAQSAERYELLPDFPEAERSWSADNQWWQVEIRYVHRTTSLLATLVGFRYDSFLTNFSNASTEPVIGDFSTFPGESADLSFNGYIPFLGVQACRVLPCVGTVRATVIWSPIVWGAFDYRENIGGSQIRASNELRRGRLLEGSIEVSMPVSACNMAVFATFRSLSAGTSGDASLQDTLFDEPFHNQYDFAFRRDVWIWGGNVSVTF